MTTPHEHVLNVLASEFEQIVHGMQHYVFSHNPAWWTGDYITLVKSDGRSSMGKTLSVYIAQVRHKHVEDGFTLYSIELVARGRHMGEHAFTEYIANGLLLISTRPESSQFTIKTSGTVQLTKQQATTLRNRIDIWLTRFTEVGK